MQRQADRARAMQQRKPACPPPTPPSPLLGANPDSTDTPTAALILALEEPSSRNGEKRGSDRSLRMVA